MSRHLVAGAAIATTVAFNLACLGLGGDEAEGSGESVSAHPLAQIDSDDDGLSDLEELQNGLDPDNPDTDDDGWMDGDEIDGNTDPLKKADHPYEGGWAIDDCRWTIEGTGDEIGDIARQFKGIDQNGDKVKLHDFCGREVLLVGAAFW